MRHAQVVRTFARAVALLLAAALAFELATRVEDWVRFRMPLLSPYRSPADLMVRDADGMHGRAGAQFRKWTMNSLGTRGPNVPVHKRDGVFRIATIGASETFGLYESPDQEFPRQLERKLQQMILSASCPLAIRSVEVLNAAAPGMSLPTIIQDVQKRLRRLDLDVVIYYPTPAQYLDIEQPRAAAPSDPGERIDLPPISRLHPRLISRLTDQAKSLTPGWLERWVREQNVLTQVRSHPVGWRFDTVPSERLTAYDEDLRQLVAAIRAIGARPVLATHANAFASGKSVDRQRLTVWEYFYPRATGLTILQFDAASAEVTSRVALALGVPLVDVRRIMDGQTDRFVDFAHFTDDGAGLVAEAMARVIIGMMSTDTSACSKRAWARPPCPAIQQPVTDQPGPDPLTPSPAAGEGVSVCGPLSPLGRGLG